MATSDDRRAALILLTLAAAGLLVRFVAQGSAAPGGVAYETVPGVRPKRDSVAARARRLARPLGRFEKIDIDRSSLEDLTRLPRIGPVLAGRIVAEREARGPFGSLEQLGRVSGIGPAVLETLGPHAFFSGHPRPPLQGVNHGGVSLNTASVEELAQLPGLGPKRARAIVEDRRRHGPYRRLEDLMRVRGIGPRLIERLRDRGRVP